MHRAAAAHGAVYHQVLHLVADRAESGPAAHSHVVGIETATSHEPRRWPLVEVVEAFRRGERFRLVAGPDLDVEPDVCAYCNHVTLTTRRSLDQDA